MSGKREEKLGLTKRKKRFLLLALFWAWITVGCLFYISVDQVGLATTAAAAAVAAAVAIAAIAATAVAASATTYITSTGRSDSH